MAKFKANDSEHLVLDARNSIDKNVAGELSRLNGYKLSPDGLISLIREVAAGQLDFKDKCFLSMDSLPSTKKRRSTLAKFKRK